jgi:hypothetical protein
VVDLGCFLHHWDHRNPAGACGLRHQPSDARRLGDPLAHPSTPSIASSSAAPSAGVTQAPAPSASPSPAPTAPAGANLTISGINENRTIACNQSVINVSGISNKIVLTGHCASLNVSGVQNSITVDAVDTIEASGFNNQITYHTGSPSIDKSGDGNVVQQG